MEYIGTEEVLRILGIKKPTLYAWVHRGKLLPHRVGRLLKFNEVEVRAMIETRWVEAWAADAPLENAIAAARREVGVGPPSLRLIYLQIANPSQAQVRVQALDGGQWIDPATKPGGMTYRFLERLQRLDGYLFLGTDVPWKVVEFHPEQGRYLTAWIERIDAAPARTTEDALEWLEKGIFPTTPITWTREELHER